MSNQIKSYIAEAVQVFKLKFANKENADIAKFTKVYVIVALNQNDGISLEEAEKLYKQNQPDVLDLKQMQHHNR